MAIKKIKRFGNKKIKLVGKMRYLLKESSTLVLIRRITLVMKPVTNV